MVFLLRSFNVFFLLTHWWVRQDQVESSARLSCTVQNRVRRNGLLPQISPSLLKALPHFLSPFPSDFPQAYKLLLLLLPISKTLNKLSSPLSKFYLFFVVFLRFRESPHFHHQKSSANSLVLYFFIFKSRFTFFYWISCDFSLLLRLKFTPFSLSLSSMSVPF